MDYTKSEKRRIMDRASKCAENAKATGTIVRSTDLDGGFEVMAANVKTGWLSSKWVFEVSGKARPFVQVEASGLQAALRQLNANLEPRIPLDELVGSVRDLVRAGLLQELYTQRNCGNTVVLAKCGELLWKAVAVTRDGEVYAEESATASAAIDKLRYKVLSL